METKKKCTTTCQFYSTDGGNNSFCSKWQTIIGAEVNDCVDGGLMDIRDDHGVGLKFDSQKEQWDLLPMDLVKECVKVLTFGAKKYGPNNWQNVEKGKERYYAALMRHIVAWRDGEANDSESNLSHLGHAMCNLVFLDWIGRGNVEDKEGR